MSTFLQELITRQPTQPKPKQAPAFAKPLVERRHHIVSDLETTVGVPHHDQDHPNIAEHRAIVALLKERNPHIHAKLMNWD
jgi:hypothetical protein